MPTRRQNGAPVALPDDDALIEYINSCAQPPRPRDVARAFHLDAKLRPALRRRLRNLAESGQLTKQNQNPSRQVEALAENTVPEISVLEILGFDDDGNAMTAFIESAPMDIGDGDKFTFIKRVIPDLTFDGSTALSSPNAVFTIKARDFPGATYDQSGTGTATRTASSPVEQFTNKLDYRIRGRSFAIKLESNALGCKFKMGTPRVDMREDGRR